MARHFLCSMVVVVVFGVVCGSAYGMGRVDNPVRRVYEQSSMPGVNMQEIRRRTEKRVRETEQITMMTARAKRFSLPLEKELDGRVAALLGPEAGPGEDVEDLRNDIRGMGANTPNEKLAQQYLSVKLSLAVSSRELRKATKENEELAAKFAECRDTAEEMKDESEPLVDRIMALTRYLLGAGGAGIVALFGLGSKWRSFRLEKELRRLDIRIKTVQAELEERKLEMGEGGLD